MVDVTLNYNTSIVNTTNSSFYSRRTITDKLRVSSTRLRLSTDNFRLICSRRIKNYACYW